MDVQKLQKLENLMLCCLHSHMLKADQMHEGQLTADHLELIDM